MRTHPGIGQRARVPKGKLAGVAVAYLVLFGALLYAWIESAALRAGRPPALGTALVCALPALLAGAVLGRHRGDPSQFIAKSVACMGMLPILLLFWGSEAVDSARTIWPYMVAFGVGHAVGFVLFVLWAAPVTTRVEPSRAAAAAAASAEQLRARLCSLPATGLPCAIAPAEGGGLLIEYSFPAKERRSLCFALELDAARRTVHVLESAGASGAAPRNADEADMRPLGTVGLDPTRPRAQRIYGNTRQATFIDPDRLAALPLGLEDGRATLPEAQARAADGTELAYVLAAITTHSGWTYAPILFRSQRG